MAEFFGMGGYAWFVWGSYGLVAAVLLQQYIAPLLRRRKLLRELADAGAPVESAAAGRASAEKTAGR